MSCPNPRRPRVALSPENQAAFDHLRTRGRQPLAELLGVSTTVIDSLEHGGLASPQSVAKVVAALRLRGVA